MRPRPEQEGEDDLDNLLRAQEAFFREKPNPAAKLINNKPKVSRFKKMQEEMRAHEAAGGSTTRSPSTSGFLGGGDKKEPELEELDQGLEEPGVAETIVERDFVKVPPLLGSFPTAGFPSIKEKRPLLRARDRSAPMTPLPTDHHKTQEQRNVEEETNKMISEMSVSEVEEHQASIYAALGDKLGSFLQKRGERKICAQMGEKELQVKAQLAEQELSNTQATSSSSRCDVMCRQQAVVADGARVASPSKSKKAPSVRFEGFEEEEAELLDARTYRASADAPEKPYEMSITDNERRKMEWMNPVEEHEASQASDVPRYDFAGHLLDKDAEGLFPALYHHGEDANRAGYATHELLHLARSSDLSQRATALKILENVVRTNPTLAALYDDDPHTIKQLPPILYWLLGDPRQRRHTTYVCALRIVCAFVCTHEGGSRRGSASSLDLIDLIEDCTDVACPRMPQEPSCSGWTDFFTGFVKPRKKCEPFLDAKILLEDVYAEPLGDAVEACLWQMRLLRGLALNGHDVCGRIPRKDLLEVTNKVLREELLYLIRASSHAIEGARWWLEDYEDVLQLVREHILMPPERSSTTTTSHSSSKQEALRIWCLWLDHGLGMDEDMDCFIPELMRQCPLLKEREQCMIIRCITKVVAASAKEKEDGNEEREEADDRIHKALVKPSHSTCLSDGAPFVRESIEAMRPCLWTRRPLERLRKLVTDTGAWPAPVNWPIYGGRENDKEPRMDKRPIYDEEALDARKWGICGGAPMAPIVPNEDCAQWLLSTGMEIGGAEGEDNYKRKTKDDKRESEKEEEGSSLPGVPPLWAMCVSRTKEHALMVARDAKYARRCALKCGIDLPLQMWGPCEDWCSALLAPFFAVKEASKEATLSLLKQIHLFEALQVPRSVLFLALSVAIERFPAEEDIMNGVNAQLCLPCMPEQGPEQGPGLAYPTGFHSRLVDMQDVLMERFLNDGVQHPALLRLLVCFAAQWAPTEVRRKFWSFDPHFPVLLSRFWQDLPIVGDPENYKELDPEFDLLLEPYRAHQCAKTKPLAYILC